MKIINKYSLITFVLLLLIFGCNSKSKNSVISDKEFSDSLTKQSKSETILYIDSLIYTNHYQGNKLGLLYLKKGVHFSNLQKDKEAINYFERALKLFISTKNFQQQAKSHMFLGSILTFVGKRELATENLLKSLEISKNLHNKKTEANVYNALAHLYFTAKDYEKSIEFTQKSIEIQIEEKDSVGLSSTYNNLAVICKNIMQLDKALKYNEISLELNKKLNEYGAVAKSYNNLGQVHELLYEEEKAISYYKKSIQLNNDHSIINTTSLRNIGYLFFQKSMPDSSLKYYHKALKIQNLNSKPKLIKIIYQGIMKNSLKTNNISATYLYQKKIDSINQTISNIENQERLLTIENQYKALANEKELEQEIKSNTKNRILFLAILFLIIITGLFLYQKNKNYKLKLAREKLILEQRVLRSQMNPHFIFNALSAIQNSLMDNDPIKSATYLSRFAKLIRQNFDFINQRTISLAEEIDALKNYMDTQILRFDNKFNYEIKISPEINTDNTNIPPLLMQPFVENCIEHGFKNKKNKGQIIISISKIDSSIVYTITDNGNGFKITENDTKDHAIDVFKKRMKLFGNKEENSFKITSDETGTQVQFKLKANESINN